jgi:hypothetical protein
VSTQATDLEHGRADFDFLTGDWVTEQHRSTKPLEDDAPWETFEATIHVRKLPGGIGNIDYMVAPDWRPGWVGVTLRVFDGETGLWSIFWMSGKTGGIDSSTGNLMAPVVGTFVDDVGVFECDEIFEGTPLRTRYAWTRVDEDDVAWEQAFSFDGGKTWKVNWTMTGRRMQGAPNAWSELAATTA